MVEEPSLTPACRLNLSAKMSGNWGHQIIFSSMSREWLMKRWWCRQTEPTYPDDNPWVLLDPLSSKRVHRDFPPRNFFFFGNATAKKHDHSSKFCTWLPRDPALVSSQDIGGWWRDLSSFLFTPQSLVCTAYAAKQSMAEHLVASDMPSLARKNHRGCMEGKPLEERPTERYTRRGKEKKG